METTSQKLDELDLWELVEFFIKAQGSPNTARTYRVQLIKFLGLLVEMGNIVPTFEAVNVKNFLAYRADMESRKDSPSTVAHGQRVLRAFASWVAKRYDVPNPLADVNIPRYRKTKVHGVRPQTREVLMALALGRFARYEDSRLAISILFCLGLGLRPSSAIGITWDNVELCAEGGRILDIPLKGGGSTWKCFGPDFAAALAHHGVVAKEYFSDAYALEMPYPVLASNYRAIPGDFESWRFSTASLRRHIDALAELIGEAFTPRTLRHTFALKYLEAGGSTYGLTHALDQSSPQITLEYTHETEAQERSRIEAMWGDGGEESA